MNKPSEPSSVPHDTVYWGAVIFLIALALSIYGGLTGAGTQYVKAVPVAVKPDAPVGEAAPAPKFVAAFPRERSDPGVSISYSRTCGVWLYGLLCLCALSFLWGDNVLFRFMQALLVGVSAGYAVVVGFWTTVIPVLLGKLLPDVAAVFVPGLAGKPRDWLYLVPLALGILLLWRLAPRGGWISRWPLAFFVGLMAGLNLVTVIKSDFVDQISNTIIPLVALHTPEKVARGAPLIDWWASGKNILVLVCVLSALTYFFFSVDHRGPVRYVSRFGVCVLMITFGAAFAMTVMTRVAIISGPLQYILDDWLWIIDPLSRRA